MPALEDRVSAGALTIDTVRAGTDSTPRLQWRGKSTERMASQSLGPFLARAVDRAGVEDVPLELRFEELDYLNSSTLTAIIHVIQSARDKSVRLAIVFDPGVRWQRLTFDALKVFVRGDGWFEMRALSE